MIELSVVCDDFEEYHVSGYDVLRVFRNKVDAANFMFLAIELEPLKYMTVQSSLDLYCFACPEDIETLRVDTGCDDENRSLYNDFRHIIMKYLHVKGIDIESPTDVYEALKSSPSLSDLAVVSVWAYKQYNCLGLPLSSEQFNALCEWVDEEPWVLPFMRIGYVVPGRGDVSYVSDISGAEDLRVFVLYDILGVCVYVLANCPETAKRFDSVIDDRDALMRLFYFG